MTRLVFVDLDGTYVRSNSFHRWLKFLAFSAQSPLSPPGRVLVAALSGLRAGRLIAHAVLKREVLQLVARLPAERQRAGTDAYIADLAGEIAAPVRAVIASLRAQGARIVMATAAPGNYAHAFAAAQGFDDCLATAAEITPGWSELLRERKAQACAAYARALALDPAAAVTLTDHRDDLPLIAQSAVTIWCGPRDELPTIQSATPARVIGLDAATGAEFAKSGAQA